MTTASRIESEVNRLWEARGWPTELLTDARRFHTAEEVILRRWLEGRASLERVREEILWVEKLQHGSMRFRQLTVADNEAFCELWAKAPEQIGDWDVTVERGPNGFASFELQERPVLNGLFDSGELVACVSFSLRQTLVGGRRVSVRYGQAMRVHQDHRGKAYAHWVRSLPWAVGLSLPTRVQYDYIRARNMTMERWNRKFMPEVSSVPRRQDEVPGIPVSVLEFPSAAVGGSVRGVRPARLGDYAKCAELINRTHRGLDLFRPYSAEWLEDRLEIDVPPGRPGQPAYHAKDFYALEQHGAIVACAGLWDRGRDLREIWRHRDSGQKRTISTTALLDLGYVEGAEDAMASLIEYFISRTHDLGRDVLIAPLETMPQVADLLRSREPSKDTHYLQWRADTPALTTPTHLDLTYW